ncbi:MAG TPA: immunoglobulin domain-containing protein, partial [Verrucomicrobiae bacterium]|nr:immunoglobulin domain-containing protein [Verrucomicrobiae bacterium]
MKPTTCKTCVQLTTRLNIFKSLVAACGLILLVPCAKAQFTWPVYEPFGEYIEGEFLGTNDMLPYWDVGNAGTNGVSSYIVTSEAAMSFPALVSDTNPVPRGVMSQFINTTSADRGFMFTTNTLSTGAMYASFLLNYLDNGAGTTTPSDRCIFNLVTGATDETNGSFADIETSVWLTPDYRLLISKNYQLNGNVFSTNSAVLATNVPHLIVVRYKVVAGGNDEMDLWIDPTPFGDDTRIPPPTLSTTNGPNMTNFNACLLESRKVPAYSAQAFYVDEIRLNDTFSGVTPLATPVPGPMFAVTGGGTTCPSSPPDVALNGSVSTNDYLLFTNNVFSGVSLPGTGSALDFGQQSIAGVYRVLASNTTTADIGWMSNSAVVALIQPPVIVAEPNPVVTATNNRAEFVVVTTGGGLGYQWYQNGLALANGTNITGAQSNDLVIWPATVASTGNYYCVITNTCGLSSTTATNSLTLDAPNSLLWV